VNGLGDGVATAALAMTSVGLWTLRVALTARGRKLLGAGVAAAEALVFVVAFTSLAANLDSPALLGGYAAGVALGTLVGLAANERLPAGASAVDIIVAGDQPRLVEHLRRLGWPATTFPGEGPSGAVTVIRIALDQRRVSDLTDTVRRLAPSAFWMVQDLGPVHGSALPAGFIQIAS
jgi:uncharacterized protein YebE (UPF0316 family)